MFGTLFALLVAAGIVVGSVFHVNTQYAIFLDIVGILLVVGGTITVAFITFNAKDVFSLVSISIAVMRQNMDDAPKLAEEIITLARDTKGDLAALQAKATSIRDPFFRDGINLIIDRLDAADIESILRDRIRIKQESDESSANMLKTLAKYPPSFGIVGTVLGLISIMQQLGGNLSAAQKIGPAMAIGLVATFYGLVLTNFVLQPLSENLAVKSYKDVRKRQMALLGVMLIKAGRPALVVQESVNSLLAVSKRVDVLGTSNVDTRSKVA